MKLGLLAQHSIYREEDMEVALQYGTTQGQGPLREWLKALQIMIHSPPLWSNQHPTNFDVIVTSGSQDGLCKVF